jgi:hypothetical protein
MIARLKAVRKREPDASVDAPSRQPDPGACRSARLRPRSFGAVGHAHAGRRSVAVRSAPPSLLRPPIAASTLSPSFSWKPRTHRAGPPLAPQPERPARSGRARRPRHCWIGATAVQAGWLLCIANSPGTPSISIGLLQMALACGGGSQWRAAVIRSAVACSVDRPSAARSE